MIKNTLMFAEWLHNTYENLAEEQGWRTQLQCQTEFKKLPKKNQAVMIRMACKIKKQFHMFFDGLIDDEVEMSNLMYRDNTIDGKQLGSIEARLWRLKKILRKQMEEKIE